MIGHARFEDEFMDNISAMEFLSGRKFTGSVMGALNFRRDFPKIMEFYRNGFIDIECMLTRRYTLEQINEAFYDAEHGAVKNVIVIGGEK